MSSSPDEITESASRLLLSGLFDNRLGRDDVRVLAHSCCFVSLETGNLLLEAMTHGECSQWTGLSVERARKARSRLTVLGYLKQEKRVGRTSLYSLGVAKNTQVPTYPGTYVPRYQDTRVPPYLGINNTIDNRKPRRSNRFRSDGDGGTGDERSESHPTKRPPSGTESHITSEDEWNESDVVPLVTHTSSDTQDDNGGFDWWSIAELVTNVSGVQFTGHGKLFADENRELFNQMKQIAMPGWRCFAEALRDMPKNRRKRLLFGRTDFFMKFIIKASSLGSAGDNGQPDIWALRAPLEERLADLEGRVPSDDVTAQIDDTKRRLAEIGT